MKTLILCLAVCCVVASQATVAEDPCSIRIQMQPTFPESVRLKPTDYLMKFAETDSQFLQMQQKSDRQVDVAFSVLGTIDDVGRFARTTGASFSLWQDTSFSEGMRRENMQQFCYALDNLDISKEGVLDVERAIRQQAYRDPSSNAIMLLTATHYQAIQDGKQSLEIGKVKVSVEELERNVKAFSKKVSNDYLELQESMKEVNEEIEKLRKEISDQIELQRKGLLSLDEHAELIAKIDNYNELMTGKMTARSKLSRNDDALAGRTSESESASAAKEKLLEFGGKVKAFGMATTLGANLAAQANILSKSDAEQLGLAGNAMTALSPFFADPTGMGYFAAANGLFQLTNGTQPSPFAAIFKEIQELRRELADFRIDTENTLNASRDEASTNFLALQGMLTDQGFALADISNAQELADARFKDFQAIETARHLLNSAFQEATLDKLDTIEMVQEGTQFQVRMKTVQMLSPFNFFVRKHFEHSKNADGVMHSYKQRIDYFNIPSSQAVKNWERGDEAVTAVLLHKKEELWFVDSYFWGGSANGLDAFSDINQRKIVRKVAQPLFKMTKSLLESSPLSKAAYRQLLAPSTSVESLDLKRTMFAQSVSDYQVPPIENCGILLNPKEVAKFAVDLAIFCQYYELIDDPNKPSRILNLDEVKERGLGPGSKALDLLTQMRRVVDIAMLQQSLFAGDAMLPEMESLFFRQYALAELARLEEERRKLTLERRKTTEYQVVESLVLAGKKSVEQLAELQKMNASDEVVDSLKSSSEMLTKLETDFRTKWTMELVTAHSEYRGQTDAAEDKASKDLQLVRNGSVTTIEPAVSDDLKKLAYRIERLYSSIRVREQSMAVDRKSLERTEERTKRYQAWLDNEKKDEDNRKDQADKLAEVANRIQKELSKSSDSKANEPDEAFNLMVESLRENPVLRRNFMVYFVRKSLSRLPTNIDSGVVAYKIATAQNSNPKAVISALGLPEAGSLQFNARFDTKRKRWQLQIDSRVASELWLDLPEAKIVYKGNLLIQPQIAELVEARNVLNTELLNISGRNAFAEVSPK